MTSLVLTVTDKPSTSIAHSENEVSMQAKSVDSLKLFAPATFASVRVQSSVPQAWTLD
jgi:hypothetical protein